ncbi:MAG: RNase adapter RapZ [Clostridiaceae bacterium]|nr:RNase adapter RapZ [Clostridiaceae bacterium]
MYFLVITGMSGAGKSLVAKYLEDLGYFCVDNLPPALIPKFAEIVSRSDSQMNKIALVIDVRGRELLNDFFPGLEALKDLGFDCKILFLEASDNVLVKRYKETRRAHPLAHSGRIVDGINEERQVLQEIRKRADHVIDTSNLSPAQLREEINSIFLQGKEFKGMIMSIITFGFKYGIPIDCDLVFDVRFLPNPYYIPSMRKLTGKNEAVREYVLKNKATTIFYDKVMDLLDFLIPYYIKEGKTQLVIGIGCTGGRHRSVVIGELIYRALTGREYTVIIEHRDIERDRRGK